MAFQYKDTQEYREVFRKITNAPSNSSVENPYNIDDETLDENNFDESSSSIFLDTVFEKTKNIVLFQTIYDLAAATMLCENRDIGLAVLCSYDYLWAFYPCYCDYCENPITFSEKNEWYMLLKTRFE